MELASAWTDAGPKMMSIMAHKDNPEAMKKSYDEVMKDFIIPRMKVYNDHLAASKSGYLTSKLSWADLVCYNMFQVELIRGH